MDRKEQRGVDENSGITVALRKESVDRKDEDDPNNLWSEWSLSARRAWIEKFITAYVAVVPSVALRKESVDRKTHAPPQKHQTNVALRKESVDRKLVRGMSSTA